MKKHKDIVQEKLWRSDKMAEDNLEIMETQKDGRVFKNLNLKTRVKAGAVIQGIQPGNHIVVKKTTFPEGRKLPNFPLYSCTCEYKGEQVSIVLNEQEHEHWKQFDIDDNIKISLEQEPYEFQGKKGMKAVLTFEKVE